MMEPPLILCILILYHQISVSSWRYDVEPDPLKYFLPVLFSELKLFLISYMLWFFHLMKLRSPISCSKNIPSLWNHRILSLESTLNIITCPPLPFLPFMLRRLKAWGVKFLRPQQLSDAPEIRIWIPVQLIVFCFACTFSPCTNWL